MHLNGLIQNVVQVTLWNIERFVIEARRCGKHERLPERDVYICTGLRKHRLKWEAFIVLGLFTQIGVKTVLKEAT